MTDNGSNRNITEAEMASLEACQSEDEWSAACDAIKGARHGAYPPDWWVSVRMSGLMESVLARFGRDANVRIVPLDVNRYRYTATISCTGLEGIKSVEFTPHAALDPSRDGDRDFNEWWWDAAGMAIVEAGDPWTTRTGIHDFHDIPEFAVHYRSRPNPEQVIVEVPGFGGFATVIVERHALPTPDLNG